MIQVFILNVYALPYEKNMLSSLRGFIFMQVKLNLCCLLILTSCGNFLKQNQSDDAPDNTDGPPLAIFGDSVASGMFADTKLGDSATLEQAKQFAELGRIKATTEAESLEYYKAVQKVSARPDKTAFGGRENYSYAARLNQLTGKKFSVWNFAVPGTTTETMQEQIPRARSTSAFAADKEPLVVFHMGANDFCDRRMTEFRGTYALRLREIAQLNPKSKIMTVMIPNIPQVLSMQERTAFKLPSRSLSCEQMRKELGFCAKVNIHNGQAAGDLNSFKKELADMNTAIKEETAKLAKELNREGKFIFAEYNFTDLTDEHLAIDCFHPSSKGQEGLAEMTWNQFKKLVQ